MINLTPSERAKRYRQRKAQKSVPQSPRAARRGDIELLWMTNCMDGNKQSLRTFYRRRSLALSFVRHTPDEMLIDRLTSAPEIVTYLLGYLLVAEWNDFLARMKLLGLPIEDMRHPLDPEAINTKKAA